MDVCARGGEAHRKGGREGGGGIKQLLFPREHDSNLKGGGCIITKQHANT